MGSFKREITAFSGIILIAFVLFFLPAIYFQILVFIFIFLTSMEISSLFSNNFKPFLIFIPVSSISWALFYFSKEIFLNYLLPFCILTPFLLILIKKPPSKEELLKVFSSISIPILTGFFGGSLAFLRKLNGEKEGLNYVLYILILVWVSDSLAYYVGKNFGKNKISPQISPNKTVEGTLSLFFGAILITFIFFKINFYNLILGLGMGLSSFFGDLIQSYAKRALQIKDSGSFFPGHGGFWDRTDSLFFSSFVFYFIKNL